MILTRLRDWLKNHVIAILAVLAIMGATGSFFLGWLLIGAREDVASAIEKCNTDKAVAIAKAEGATRVLLQSSFAERLAVRDRRIESLERARQIAEEGREFAVSDTQGREARIRQLELEAETDEIPDSFEALNVFIPNCALDWVRVPTGDNREAGTGTDSGSGRVCTSARRFDPTAPFARTFSSLTYADGLIAWGRDRDELRKCNADKAAIQELMNHDD